MKKPFKMYNIGNQQEKKKKTQDFFYPTLIPGPREKVNKRP